jgi:hypothetical protein
MEDHQEILQLLQLIDNVMAGDNQAAKDAFRKFIMVASLVEKPEDEEKINGPVIDMLTSMAKRISSLEHEVKHVQAVFTSNRTSYPKYDNSSSRIMEDYYKKYYTYNIGGVSGTSIDEFKKFK